MAALALYVLVFGFLSGKHLFFLVFLIFSDFFLLTLAMISTKVVMKDRKMLLMITLISNNDNLYRIFHSCFSTRK